MSTIGFKNLDKRIKYLSWIWIGLKIHKNRIGHFIINDDEIGSNSSVHPINL